MKTLINATACLASLFAISSSVFAGPIVWTSLGVSANAFGYKLEPNGDYYDPILEGGVGISQIAPLPVFLDDGFQWDHPSIRMDTRVYLFADSQQLTWGHSERSSAAEGFRIESGNSMFATFNLTSSRSARISMAGDGFAGEHYGGLAGPAGAEFAGNVLNQSIYLPAGEYNFFFLFRSKGPGTESNFRLRFMVPDSGHTFALFAGALAALGLVKARRTDPR